MKVFGDDYATPDAAPACATMYVQDPPRHTHWLLTWSTPGAHAFNLGNGQLLCPKSSPLPQR